MAEEIEGCGCGHHHDEGHEGCCGGHHHDEGHEGC
ncbi:FKBP-type peptidyl-prolyl cis-trans isomerase SlyD, partial [Parafannyhessea umbonata]